eukprot:745882-Hanusia_phi.AAC.3
MVWGHGNVHMFEMRMQLQAKEGDLKTAVITRRPLKGVHTDPEPKKSTSLFSALGDIGGLASSSISSLRSSVSCLSPCVDVASPQRDGWRCFS